MSLSITTPAGVDELRVRGALAEDARVVYTPGARPEALLTFDLLPAVGMPYRVKQRLGNDPQTFYTAEAKARCLRKGSVVQVYAKGIRAQTEPSPSMLYLLDVTDVFPLFKNPAAHTEAISNQGA